MKHLLKQLAGESMIYGISGMVSRFIGIFLVPLYTRLLAPEDYGALGLVNSTFYFVIVLAVFALDSAAARWYYDSDDIEEKKKTIASWFWFQLATSLALCLLVSLASPLLAKMILKDSSRYFLFVIPAIGLIANILPTMVSNWLRFQRKAGHTVVFTLGNVLLNVGLNVLFVLYFKWGIKGILLATLFSNGLATLYVLSLMSGWIQWHYLSIDKLRQMLKYALPLIPTSIAFWVLNSSSTFVVEHFHGEAAVGLYTIAAMLASAVTMVVGAFQMAWGPFAFSIIEKPEAKNTYSIVLTLYTGLMSFAALGIALFAREGLMILATKAYYDAYIAAGILAFNGIIYGSAYIAVMGCSIMKDNKPLAWSVLMAAACTAVLYFVLVPRWGIEGAAVSTALGYLVVPVYLFYRSQKYYFIPYRFVMAVLLFFSAIGLYIISFYLYTDSTMMNILIKSVLLLSYLLIIFVLAKVYYPEQVQALISRIARKHV